MLPIKAVSLIEFTNSSHSSSKSNKGYALKCQFKANPTADLTNLTADLDISDSFWPIIARTLNILVCKLFHKSRNKQLRCFIAIHRSHLQMHHIICCSHQLITSVIICRKPHTKVCDKHKPYWMPYNIKQAHSSICIHLQKQTEAEMLRAINHARIIAKKECSSVHERTTNIISVCTKISHISCSYWPIMFAMLQEA